MDQDRDHNSVNEIDNDDDHGNSPSGTITAGAGQSNWADPEHDAAGNMTTMPQPKNLGSSYTAVYDAWNRMVEVADSGGTVLTNEYDGNHHRIQKVVGADTFDYYYNHRWQVLKETKNGSSHATNAWHPFYIDALAVRRDAAGNRNYFTHDANFNVTAAVDVDATSGTFKQVVERYAYSPYGEVTFLEPDFDPIAGNESAIGNEILYTGRTRDPVTGLYNFRTRFYHAPLGRFTSRDWIEYGGGMNLYGYVGGMPTGYVDPFGLFGGIPIWPEQGPVSPPALGGGALPSPQPGGGGTSPPVVPGVMPPVVGTIDYSNDPSFLELWFHYSEPGVSAPADPAWLNWGNEAGEVASLATIVTGAGKLLLKKLAFKKAKKEVGKKTAKKAADTTRRLRFQRFEKKGTLKHHSGAGEDFVTSPCPPGSDQILVGPP